MNETLRAGAPLGDETAEVARALDDAFEHVRATRIEGTVWRALRDVTFEYPDVGEYMEPQLAYTSTTMSKEYGERILTASSSGDLWEIVLPRGSHVLDMNLLIGSKQSHEDEILLQRGVDLMVLSARPRTDGKPGRIVRLKSWA